MPASFLALPRELRDQIYDALWISTPKITLLDHPSKGRIVACYKSLVTRETALPTWLLTNKQTLSEATAQMVRHGTWIVRLRSDYDAPPGTVLSPTLARRLTLTLTHALEGPRPRWPHVVRDATLGPSRENAACLAHALEHIAGSRNARDVRLVLELVREEPGARLDLAPLEAASCLRPGLRSLEVVVMREQVYRAYSAGFVEAVGAEVKRVGNKVLGSDEDPSVCGFLNDSGLVYTFSKPGDMELCRVDSAVAEAGC
ncbi:hypothetical protein C7974DRAFT_445344 [Boeremia exigua]|uniref:uncharacterized protein n=1 Tax=Boeremia exigua TaxID=749465 RepID=UPI001E8DD309|nr:uncharacterized protein C7974DRAFT_445344 [Boeremia exigua]KAH6612590.1 hypothetical protein C7974DRAFT_445344 [Boeremia exigua]